MNRPLHIYVEVSTERVGFQADEGGIGDHAIHPGECTREGSNVSEICAPHLDTQGSQGFGKSWVAHDGDGTCSTLQQPADQISTQQARGSGDGNPDAGESRQSRCSRSRSG